MFNIELEEEKKTDEQNKTSPNKKVIKQRHIPPKLSLGMKGRSALGLETLLRVGDPKPSLIGGMAMGGGEAVIFCAEAFADPPPAPRVIFKFMPTLVDPIRVVSVVAGCWREYCGSGVLVGDRSGLSRRESFVALLPLERRMRIAKNQAARI
jgi:hypothetical protein